MSQAKQNDNVKVHYTGKLHNGEIFDSSVDREPLAFTIGMGQMIPGFEKGVLNMEVNEKKTINIPASEAYGEVREDMKQEVPKSQLPPDLKVEQGMALSATTPDGRQQRLIVAEVKEDTILVDGNHPLAGKDLIFEVELVSIN